MIKKVDFIRLIIITLITAILMSTVSFTLYTAMAQPKFYARFMELGNKYFQEGKYEEAILEFTKAIQIEGKSTRARIGLAKSSIEIDDIDAAVKALKEAQQIDFENTELLKEIIDILKDADPNAAYEILMNYVNKKGEANINSEIRKLLDSAKEEPKIPELIPPSGTYIKAFSLKLQSDKVRVGHTFYYSIGDTMPNKTSMPYRGSIKIDNSINIRLIGYNPAGKATEIFEANYILDTEIEPKIKNLIKTAQNEMDATEVGTDVGNCIEGAKEELTTIIKSTNKNLDKNIVSLDEANILYEELNDALYNFRQKIIVSTERNSLKNEIEKAEKLINGATEGNEVGQYRNGAKNDLSNVIATAKTTNENLIARQNDIDKAKNDLTAAINRFNAKKVTELDKIIADTGAKIGPVTVSLLWNTTDDLDLHVTSPNGDTISYNNKRGSSGGQLDVDRQVNSFVSNPVENIYWATAPNGTYQVKVNVYSKRTSGSIPFQVRVIVNGESKLYNMSIDSGTINICSFAY